ncbi:capsular biosynthesis protein [Thiocapsa imhoffii]|uniref:protein-tyrosine-phosphatase n=1 Tax=Thiocapsa imhoffii TaxID=382777 RepID=A0A9X0WL08_9GAMM|nr:CpsB/CapC family capsule biosynthesis tyrosine phosphatase [Thiocapsa imhoffii]MBK1646553.1 capsular biosynthesis protein [Thiocapsa imhoffii]
MIDLHCHLLPGIDDGSPDLSTSLEMARIALSDGITTTACTPHIYPGLYENRAEGIRAAIGALRQALAEADLPLNLTEGADIQLAPEMIPGLRQGTHPTLNGTRYFLFEPPHHTVPVHFQESIHDCLAFGFVPVITHPERLTWLDAEHYPWFVQAARQGAWIQLTAGALTGRFGRTPKYWGERMLDEGLVHILATDSHETRHRPPILSEGRDAAVRWVGAEEAERLVELRPQAILDNRDPVEVPPPPMLDPSRTHEPPQPAKRGLFARLFR